MNHSEPGLAQGTTERRQSSEIPVRAIVRREGKHPLAKSVERRLCWENNTRTFLPSAYISGLYFQPQSRINSHARETSFVHWLAFYSTLEDRW